MFDYRKTLYQNYYSNHAGVSGEAAQRVHFEQQKRYFIREFAPLLPIDQRSKILDIGCGSGSFLKGMNELGYPDTTGIDLSPEQVAKAAEFGVANVSQSDAASFLSQHEAGFDLITAIDLIEHLSKDELILFLQSVRKALKPGGGVIFRTPNMDAPQASVFAFADFTHEVFLNKSSALQLMASCGFSAVEVHPSYIFIENPVKEIFRKLLWFKLKLFKKASLFATARTWHDVVFTPNIVITGKSV